jgi:tRNA G18 (ribose-2'-O)-methylase SpoU
MQTRCPYPDCLTVFIAPAQRAGNCPDCARPMSFRQLEVLLDIERRKERLLQASLSREEESDSLQDRHVPVSPVNAAARPALPALSINSNGITAIVEDVRSLWNIGSIFRTADGAGIKHLFLCGISGSPPRKEIAKVSLGAELTVAWSYHVSALEPLYELKERGVFIMGLEYTRDYPLAGITNSTDLGEALENGRLRFPLCLVAGNEVTGVSAELLAACDIICHLPMRGMKESLNVAVAFGIAAYLLADEANAQAGGPANP